MVFASITRISSNHTANILKIPFPSKPNDNNHTFRPFFLQKRVSPSRESHRSLRVSTGFSSLFFSCDFIAALFSFPVPNGFPAGLPLSDATDEFRPTQARELHEVPGAPEPPFSLLHYKNHLLRSLHVMGLWPTYPDI